MKKNIIEVRRGHVTVKVYTTTTAKKGRRYVSHVVPDYSSGQRKLWTFGDLAAAKDKAGEIAQAVATGRTEVLNWQDELRLELRKALEVVQPTGLSILPASQLFAQAVKILGGPDDLLSACQYWAHNKPSNPITPSTADDFKAEFLAKPSKRTPRRQRTLMSSLRTFCRKFGTILLHEVKPSDLADFVDTQRWAPKTRNSFLADVSLFFTKAALCGHVPEGCNPTKTVERLVAPRNACGIFTPVEMKIILYALADKLPELVPFMALWSFAGIREQEVARMTWPQVNRGLLTGFIELAGHEVKANGARNVPVLPNLRAWLTAYRQDTGYILPAHWREGFKLDDITCHIARRTRLPWVSNGPRHSFATYRFKLVKDPGQVTLGMGTSLEKFQRHYWSKSQVVTEAEAQAWFAIVPPQPGNLVLLPKAGDGTGTTGTVTTPDQAAPLGKSTA